MIKRVLTWYFSRRALPYWCVLLCDCSIVVVSMLAAQAMNAGTLNMLTNFVPLTLALCTYMVCFLLGFRLFHTYSGVLRYSSFVDLFRILGSLIVGSALVFSVRHLAHSDDYLAAISAHDLLTGSLIAMLLMWSVRIFIKMAFDSIINQNKNTQNVLIYGTKKGGVSIAKSLRNQEDTNYKVKGFITNLPDMVGHTLMNQPVIGDTDPKLWEFIEKQKISMMLISPAVQEFFVNECQSMIDRLIKARVKIMMMPAEQEWDGQSDVSHLNLKEVSVEELLPRKKIDVDMNAIGEMLKDKRILITGAAGSIGSEMVRQVAKFNPSEMVLIDQAETPMHDVRLIMARLYPKVRSFTIVTSITNETHMEAIFHEHKPEYVFHAAAYKHVPMMEDNPALAVQNNVYGTRVIADMAVKYGAKKFVMISTDKAVNPTNVMGCSKRICEIYCQALNKAIVEGTLETKTVDGRKPETQFVTTRFGNVLGSNGSVIPIFKEQIRKGGPVTVTHPDIIRFFMLIPEACRLVLEAGTMGKGGEIFVFDMGKPVKIVDLAQRMINLMGAKKCKIAFTGLRDGEKLYEEVLNGKEQTKPTHHPKIKIAAVREYQYEEALRNEKELYKISFTYDDMEIVRKMKEIVPEYQSKQSKYEILDK